MVLGDYSRGAAGVALSFALWWVYSLVPHGLALGARRKKVVPWAYGHLLYAWLISSLPRNVLLHLAVLILPIIAIVLAFVGSPLWVCLLLTLAWPVTAIVTYESGGWRVLEMQLAGLLAPPASSERKA